MHEGILAQYRVLDLTNEQGFLCGKILGDLGADVIKIEPPGGDPARNLGPFYQNEPHPEKSLYWWAYNNNKRGITLNLETSDGRELFKRLVVRADFVVESFPPDYLVGLGLDYPVLRDINPRIILTSITPFGQEGPYRNYRGGDLTVLAMSGLMSFLGDADRPPVRPTFPQSYLWGGAHAAFATLLAHYSRELTGKGQHVDVSRQAATLCALSYAPLFWDLGQEGPRRAGKYITGRNIHGAVHPGIYPCKDGHVTFVIYGGATGAKTNKSLVAWMDEMGLAPDYLKEKDWDHFSIAEATQEELDQFSEAVARFVRNLTKEEFFRGAVARGLMGYPVSTAKDIAADPQLQSRAFWVEVEHPELAAKITYPGAFAKLSDTPLTIRRRAPLIGEHNREIYQGELGFTDEEMVRLKQARVI